MLRRVASMAFAPRMMAFPGGGVDVRDADPACRGPGRHRGSGPGASTPTRPRRASWWPPRCARSSRSAACCSPAVRRLGDRRCQQRGVARAARLLLDRSRSLSEVLIANDLVLRSDLLAYRSHWITPEFEPRRYDTRFFTAQVPAGQRADDHSTEADVAGWMLASDVLRARERGEAMMLPPTLVSVEEIAAAASASVFLAEQPPVAPVMPVSPDRRRAGAADGAAAVTLSPGPATAEHWGGGQATPRALHPGAQPRADDARWHQHLGAARAGVHGGPRHRPGPARRGPPAAGPSARRGRGARCVQTILTHGHVDTPRVRGRGSPS